MTVNPRAKRAAKGWAVTRHGRAGPKRGPHSGKDGGGRHGVPSHSSEPCTTSNVLITYFWNLPFDIYFLKWFLFIYFLEREEWREKDRETSMWKRNINWLPLACPGRELNWWPFGPQPSAQSTEPYQSGCHLIFSHHCWLWVTKTGKLNCASEGATVLQTCTNTT